METSKGALGVFDSVEHVGTRSRKKAPSGAKKSSRYGRISATKSIQESEKHSCTPQKKRFRRKEEKGKTFWMKKLEERA
ncbi:UNVERIFIED_CONTAM: hypothetical protein HHA_450110 [Hammondia hammondi]|eukprot:XP_008889009.1 hypothetical protein HHA_450110 [Hammondia hammondi]